MYQASFRRKPSAVALCKSIESAIQWFQIHHGITFVTIHNSAVYLSGARVSISPTLVPRLIWVCLRLYFYLCNCMHVTGDSRVTGPYTNKTDLI